VRYNIFGLFPTLPADIYTQQTRQLILANGKLGQKVLKSSNPIKLLTAVIYGFL